MKIIRQQFNEAMKKQVALDPELAECLADWSMGMQIDHPLCKELFYIERMNGWYNTVLFEKKKSVKETIDKKEWSHYLFLHERPYRLQAFLAIRDKMTDKEYWELLSSIWVDSENIWQNKAIWKMLLKSPRKGKDSFMSFDDGLELNKLFKDNGTIQIYRGYVKGKNKKGFSYTLDRDKAEWFSTRFQSTPYVKELTVTDKEVFAYLSGRGEKEIIYLGNK
jgi:hypothetical protein